MPDPQGRSVRGGAADPVYVTGSDEGALEVAVTGGALTDIELRATAVPAVLTAGETHVGQTGGHSEQIQQTPTITAGAYAANDAVGGMLTFANAARIVGGTGSIEDMLIIDDSGQDAELELWLFRDTFTAMVDNAPWAPSEADLRKLVAVLSTSAGTWLAAGTPSVVGITEIKGFRLVGTSLFGQLVTKETPTFVATDDLTVILKVWQD